MSRIMPRTKQKGDSIIYAVGAYGTGNLGDDAIFNGLRKAYSNYRVIQLYVNVPSSQPAVLYGDILRNGFPLNENAQIIIGGGGLLFAKNAIKDFSRIASLGKRAGYNVKIQGLGAEYACPSYYSEIRELCDKCLSIGVRSQKSKDILEKEVGIKIPIIVEKDFAYNLEPDMNAARTIMPSFEEDLPIVGIATSGQAGKNELTHLVRRLTQNNYNVLHIPHVRHYTDVENNEVLTGEAIWSSIDIFYGRRLSRFKLLPFASSPEQLLGIYNMIDAVVGQRYHSFIFAEMAKTPLYGNVDGRKAEAFFEEHPGFKNSSGFNKEELLDDVNNFLKNRQEV